MSALALSPVGIALLCGMVLVVGIVIGFHARQANDSDTEALQIARHAAAYNDGHRAGWNHGWRECDAARMRKDRAQADAIDGHLRKRAGLPTRQVRS